MIQPKTITGRVERKIVAIVAGFTVPLGQANTKLNLPKLKRTAMMIHNAPITNKKYAFISCRRDFFPLQ